MTHVAPLLCFATDVRQAEEILEEISRQAFHDPEAGDVRVTNCTHILVDPDLSGKHNVYM